MIQRLLPGHVEGGGEAWLESLRIFGIGKEELGDPP